MTSATGAATATAATTTTATAAAATTTTATAAAATATTATATAAAAATATATAAAATAAATSAPPATAGAPVKTPGRAVAPAGGKGLHARLLAALAGETLDFAEALALYTMPEDSPQAQALISAARLLTRQANGGRGQVFAQIGLDALPCPEMCQYCSFAANSTALEARDVLSLDEVVAYARAFDAAGIHLVSLMATAACDFQRYLAITAAVRQVLQPSVPILANLGDLDAGQAQALRQAGANAIYHAVRLGEGSITNIDPTRRWQTISHASLAGLKLMTGVEPLYEQQQPQDVVNRMFETLRSGALCTGCCPLVPVVGTPLADAGCTPPTPQRRQLIGAIYRLVIGTSIPFGLGGISWVDAGTNPRGRHLSKDPAELQRQVAEKKQALAAEGWSIPARPLPEWQA